jgi:hypothetical protein
MEEDTKQMLIWAVVVVIVVVGFILGGQGCDVRMSAAKQQRTEKIAECIAAGRQPLECREALE